MPAKVFANPKEALMFWKRRETSTEGLILADLEHLVIRQGHILDLLYSIERKLTNMDPKLQLLADAVQKETSVVGSAITLIQGLAQALKDAANDPAEVASLAQQLSDNADALAAVVHANTPGGSAPAPAPTAG